MTPPPLPPARKEPGSRAKEQCCKKLCERISRSQRAVVIMPFKLRREVSIFSFCRLINIWRSASVFSSTAWSSGRWFRAGTQCAPRCAGLSCGRYAPAPRRLQPGAAKKKKKNKASRGLSSPPRAWRPFSLRAETEKQLLRHRSDEERGTSPPRSRCSEQCR